MLYLFEMPTKKRRIGFIPRFDVLKVIDNISEEEKLSNATVVNILIEEALYARGLIKKVEKSIYNNDIADFMNKIINLQNILSDDDLKSDNGRELFMKSKNNTKIYKIFIQFLHFKKMMNMFEKFN